MERITRVNDGLWYTKKGRLYEAKHATVEMLQDEVGEHIFTDLGRVVNTMRGAVTLRGMCTISPSFFVMKEVNVNRTMVNVNGIMIPEIKVQIEVPVREQCLHIVSRLNYYRAINKEWLAFVEDGQLMRETL